MAPTPAARRRPRREPSLRDEIRESGETSADAAAEAERADREDFAFVAREFLTWLVWHAETQGGTFAAEGDVPDFSIQFGGRVALRAGDGLVSDVVLKGAAPGMSADTLFREEERPSRWGPMRPDRPRQQPQAAVPRRALQAR